jgi:hypothetical protein
MGFVMPPDYAAASLYESPAKEFCNKAHDCCQSAFKLFIMAAFYQRRTDDEKDLQVFISRKR